MGQKTVELIEVLGQIIKILENDGELHWSRWMRKAQGRLIDSDYSGISYLLSAYGGMGSFNDLVIGQDINDGKFSCKPSYIEMNNNLQELRDRAAQLAHEIQRLQ